MSQRKNTKTVAEVANLDFDEVSDNAQVSGGNAKSGIAIYLFAVSSRRASVGEWEEEVMMLVLSEEL